MFNEIELVLNQRMRVLNAMVPGKTYSTEAAAEAAGLPTARTRRALRALAKDGMVLKTYGHERMAGIPYYGDERDELPLWVRMV